MKRSDCHHRTVGRLVQDLIRSLEDDEAEDPATVELAWAAELEDRAARALSGEPPGRDLELSCDEARNEAHQEHLNKPVRLSGEAEQELVAAEAWYEERARLGRDFVRAVRESGRQIVEAPALVSSGAARFGPIRDPPLPGPAFPLFALLRGAPRRVSGTGRRSQSPTPWVLEGSRLSCEQPATAKAAD